VSSRADELDAGSTGPPHFRVDDHEYCWRIDGNGLAIFNADGGRLDPVAAEVLLALGGTEPAWYSVGNALVAAYKDAGGRGKDAIAAAAEALGLGVGRRAELARTTDDRAVLVALAAYGNIEVGANPLCDRTAWDLVLKHRDPDIRRKALASNEQLPPALSNHPDLETRVRVARNWQCSVEVLEKLSDQEPRVRAAVAANPSTTHSTLKRLARDENTFVRRAIASSPKCPRSCITPLLHDRFADVRAAAVMNPEVSRRRVAARIISDPTPAVHVAIAARTDLKPGDLSRLERFSRHDPLPQYKLVCSRLSQHPSCSPSLKRRIEGIEKRIAALTAEEIARREEKRVRQGKKPCPRAILGMTLAISTIAATVGFVAAGFVHLVNGQLTSGTTFLILGLASGSLLYLCLRGRVARAPVRSQQKLSRPDIILMLTVMLAIVTYLVGATLQAKGSHVGGPLEITGAATIVGVFLVRGVRRERKFGSANSPNRANERLAAPGYSTARHIRRH
jgi:hypothetical protein